MKSNRHIIRQLPLSTFRVFQSCAYLYPNIDTNWGDDLDIIYDNIKYFDVQILLDTGCGTCWHLNKISLNGRSIEYIVGLDYSSEMLRIAEQTYAIKQNNKIKLVLSNILCMPFSGGYYDLVLCLNNTLGNIAGNNYIDAKRKRKVALKEIYRVTRNGGHIVLSVFDQDRVQKDKYGIYFKIDNTINESNRNDLVVKYYDPKQKNGGGIPYYSHWFEDSEINKELKLAGFNVINKIRRDKRIIIVAEKKRDERRIN